MKSVVILASVAGVVALSGLALGASKEMVLSAFGMQLVHGLRSARTVLSAKLLMRMACGQEMTPPRMLSAQMPRETLLKVRGRGKVMLMVL